MKVWLADILVDRGRKERGERSRDGAPQDRSAVVFGGETDSVPDERHSAGSDSLV